MAACLMPGEYESRTYIKQIGEFQLTCDRIYHMGDETEISPEEEAEALEILNDVLEGFKKHLYMHSLRKVSPVRIEVKSKKEMLFGISEAYWNAWEEELIRRDAEEDEREAADEAAKLAQLKKNEE
ncbi:hypothetical protein BGW38_009501 [Lunasporangiospora selenospora]|uniref:Uncharacterized protein n=1 Tax=Lunasporangiospora selenospora TaxID=979761 RepID=A0A9P6FIH2_9FUNG|nr:hypothetical protein BGW38_009501 [Lunasporangiospora selenospora]